MEYVADELGVAARAHARAPARALAPRRLGRDPRAAATHQTSAGRTSCTRTRRRPARPAASPRYRFRARAVRGRSSTPSTATSCSGYFSRRRSGRSRSSSGRSRSRTGRARSRSASEVRDDLVALGVAPPERDRGDPVRLRPLGAESAAASANASARSSAPTGSCSSAGSGRLTAIKQPLDAVRTLARACARTASTRCSCSSATARSARRRRGARRRARRPAARAASSASAGISRPWYAAFDALLLTSLNEGTPVARSRRSPPSGRWWRRASAGCPRSSATARTASSRRSATSTALARRGSPSSRATPALRERLGRARRRADARALLGRPHGRRDRRALRAAARA